MGSSVDSYLHKKFKKQLSIIEPTTITTATTTTKTLKTNESTASQSKSNEADPNSSTKAQSSNYNNNHITTTIANKSISTILATSNISANDNEDDEDQSQANQPGMATLPQPSNNSNKYVCTYCNLVCSKPSVLQKHIRAHTNERPYPCISCGFSFKTRSNLYKHCRSRTHANRVMGNTNTNKDGQDLSTKDQSQIGKSDSKPYKPRFHSAKENMDDEHMQHMQNHISEIINKNTSIVNGTSNSTTNTSNNNNVEYAVDLTHMNHHQIEEPLNLSNKNRKRSMSELITTPVTEPQVQKSLIKELLLKNVYSNHNMQCQYCKMIFQTVTELELHEFRSCKGKPSGAKYTRSSSVNVASILTQNKNAFDSIPYLQNTTFPLNSPGPFLGKTRLVESDKSKSFSFDNGNLSSSLSFNMFDKKVPVKLFGGEVKIAPSADSKKFKMDNSNINNNNSNNNNSNGMKFEEHKPDLYYDKYTNVDKMTNVVKFSLQSGGTVLTNKCNKLDTNSRDLIDLSQLNNTKYNNKMENTDTNTNIGKTMQASYTNSTDCTESNDDNKTYPNIMDFSQKAVKLLTPQLRQPSIIVSAFPNNNTNPTNVQIKEPTKDVPMHRPAVIVEPSSVIRKISPVNLLVNGKVVRHVPGMPGPLVQEKIHKMQQHEPMEMDSDDYSTNSISTNGLLKSPHVLSENKKKSLRPNSLALKPSLVSLKQHHGLTPTMFNQILISPDTPRVNKKYVQHFLHGNYFSYLDLKSSTKPVYCTLNKTQPFYVPHFKKLSMYSEWRQQDTKTDKLYVSAYDSRNLSQKYVQSGGQDLKTTYSYKFIMSELPSSSPTSSSMDNNVQDDAKSAKILENDDYTYIRGRGRGRYVCQECGIRCKKPSMLKKHLRTHSIDRPYTCQQCNFSFKTKGNLTKHMKSKVHSKNQSAESSSSSLSHHSTEMSDNSDLLSDNDSNSDDGSDLELDIDSSDDCTSNSNMNSINTNTMNINASARLQELQEHEAAYGLLSLSQKSATIPNTNNRIMNTNSSEFKQLSPQPKQVQHKQLVESSRLPIVTQQALDNTSLDKNSMAKSVASEYLKLATQFDHNIQEMDTSTIGPITKDVNDIIAKTEGNKTCGICHKSFSKPSQLRLHMNIHYLERPFRCDSCSVSFRTKGHLLKHERSASHHNKLSASSIQASAEPRPFKCSDCKIAFRIHGHLAKHLRSKMHIMKLECLAKIPFGLYAELERSNSLLTEINTCDGEQCLQSLKTLAQKVFDTDSRTAVEPMDSQDL